MCFAQHWEDVVHRKFPAGRLPKNWERGTCWYGKCKAQQEDL